MLTIVAATDWLHRFFGYIRHYVLTGDDLNSYIIALVLLKLSVSRPLILDFFFAANTVVLLSPLLVAVAAYDVYLARRVQVDGSLPRAQRLIALAWCLVTAGALLAIAVALRGPSANMPGGQAIFAVAALSVLAFANVAPLGLAAGLLVAAAVHRYRRAEQG